MTYKFKVDGDTIVVESLPIYYVAEECGDKRCTIRKRTAQDVAESSVEVFNGTGAMFVNGQVINKIRVINTHVAESFERELTHVCVHGDTFIYCW